MIEINLLPKEYRKRASAFHFDKKLIYGAAGAAVVVLLLATVTFYQRYQVRSLDEKIALVSHGAFGSFLLSALLGESSQPVFYHLDNTSISLIRFRRVNEISVRYLNRLAHLPPEMVT